MKLKVEQCDLDGHNGHHTVHCRVIDEDGREGAMESHGIDSLALHARFNGDVRKWLKHIQTKMCHAHERRCKTSHSLIDLQGQTLDFQQE